MKKKQYKPWYLPEDQMIVVNGRRYSMPTLFPLAARLEVFDLSLQGLNLNYSITSAMESLRHFAMHCEAVAKASLDYPIILCPDGLILDGRHRVVKALMQGRKTIRAVQFDDYPEHTQVE
jgi:hypothetical protein